MAPPKNWLMRFLGFGPYFRRRTGGLEGIAVASFLGVASGVYIFQPLFEEMAVNRTTREANEALEASGIAAPQSSNEPAKK